MRYVLLAVASAGGFGFTSSAENPAWTAVEGRICKDLNIAPHTHPNADVAAAQCYAKCKDGGAGCDGFDSDLDTPDSEALCVDVATCKSLCWGLDECQSIDVKGNSTQAEDRCYLNRWDCAAHVAAGDLQSRDGWVVFSKLVPWQQECALGLSVEVSGGDFGVDGTFLAADDGDANVFNRADGQVRVKWSGCDWRVEKTATAEEPAANQCADDVSAANFLFGLGPNDGQGTYNPDVCAVGKVAGYCSDELFVGVCPATCGLADETRCLGDNNAAAAALAARWNVDVSDCSICTVPTETSELVGEYDPVVRSICKTTCGDPNGDATLAAPENTRRLTSHKALDWSQRRLRRLTETWKEYFWASGPTSADASPPCAETSTRDLGALSDTSVCDVIRFEQAVPGLTMEQYCPEEACYSTVENTYCTMQNVARENDLVAADLCSAKCSDGATDPGCELDELPGSFAVCLAREQCEALCTSLGDDCISIDMHRTKPRCYLNQACEGEKPVDGNYQLLEKSMGRGCYDTTSNMYCPGNNIDPTAHASVAAHQCLSKCKVDCEGDTCWCDGADGLNPESTASSTDTSFFAVCMPRAECEALCTSTEGCVSIDMHRTKPRCYLNTVAPGDCAVTDDTELALVAKRADAGCVPKVVRKEQPSDELYGSLADGVDGLYDQRVDDTFTRADGAFALTWTDCGYWKLERLTQGEDPAWIFSSAQRSDVDGLCNGRRLDEHPRRLTDVSAKLNSALFYSSCPVRPGMKLERVCDGRSICEVLTRCVIEEERMTIEKALRPGEPLGTSEGCAAYLADQKRFVARQIASPSRVEYNVDVSRYGPHFLGHKVYRWPKTGAVPSFELAAIDTVDQLSIVVEAPGESYALPEGFGAWVSDAVKIEAFGSECTPATGQLKIKFYETGASVRGFVFGAATTPAAVEEGHVLVDLATVGNTVTVLVASDIDECATSSPCDANAVCTNTVGGYTCACPEGYTGDGLTCEPITFTCPPLSVRVANAAELDFGWRVREMRLYVDGECTEEVGAGPVALYAATPGATCTGELIATAQHERELIKTNNCYNKCFAGSAYSQRRLSRARRMQQSGSDWSNCAGLVATDSSDEATALCVTQPTCEQACNQLEGCAGYVMENDNRCVLYSTCGAGSGTGTAYVKSTKWAVSSSQAFEGHPNSLVYDTFGKDDETDDHHTFTEWWSNCFSCAKDEAWVQVSVELPESQQGRCQIGGLKVWQDPNNAASRIHVQLGPRDRPALPESAGVRPDVARQRADMGADWAASWAFDALEGACHKLQCGASEYWKGDLLLTIPTPVESACLCKQYCLDYLERGCRAWRLQAETDANFDPTPNQHTHATCFLLTGDISTVPGQFANTVSGGVDTILQGFEPSVAQPSEVFSLVVAGVGLPGSGKQRVKLVASDDAAGCGGVVPDSVSGVGCSDPAVCAPRPAASVATSATWSQLVVASGKATAFYTVCYCAGPCYAEWQYVPLPGSLEIPAKTFSWSAPELDWQTGAFNLTVERPPFDSHAHPSVWRSKIVRRSSDCADYAALNETSPSIRVELSLDAVQWQFGVPEVRASSGKYIVCFCEVEDGTQETEQPCTDWTPIASEVGRFLTVSLVDADFVPPAGLFRGQRFSSRAGQEVKISVGGRDLLTASVANTNLTVTADCSNTTSATIVEKDAEGSTNETLVYATIAPAASGVYSVCVGSTKVGTLTVTTRVEMGWTYIFDPNLDGSLEITGTGLDYTKDRVMVVGCTATCGLSSPADDAVLGGRAATLKVANSFIALNDQNENETTVDSEVVPVGLRSYVRKSDSYCRGGNIAAAELGAHAAKTCYSKCSACGDACPAECSGYSAVHDGAGSSALCLKEVQCRELCSGMANCYGIDMYKYASRCYLNLAGGDTGCQSQVESKFGLSLGSSPAYDFLAKDAAGTASTLANPSAISSSEVLRFTPIGFSRAARGGSGKFKVCFCDSTLLPAGQEECIAESDYSLEVGTLYVSGVSCLLADPQFRRGLCYSMWHGGLACSQDLTLPTVDLTLGTPAGLPTSWSSLPL